MTSPFKLNLRSTSIAVSRTCIIPLALLSIQAARAQEPEPTATGPKSLVITYRCAPQKRAAFREFAAKGLTSQFDAWKKDGVFESYRFLFNWYVDADTWDMLAVLTFHEYEDLARWRSIERAMPGGLSAEGLAMASPVNTYSMDLTWEKHTASPDPSKSVFFVIPYVYSPNSTADYTQYAAGYVIPQLDGWMKEKVLTGYSIYLNRYPTSRPWQVLFLLEYRDMHSLGQREAVVARVRADLAHNPAWKELSDGKLKTRVEKETVIADPILPERRPE